MLRKLTRREFLWASTVAASAAALAACSPKPTAVPDQPTVAEPTTALAATATVPPAQPTAVAPTAAPAATATVAAATESVATEGGVLRCAFGSQRADLCPMQAQGRVNVDTNRKIYSALAYLDPQYNLKPDLAERWEISEDSKAYTFFLRKTVKWHDGQPFTAKDVIFSFTRHADPACASYYSAMCDPIVGVDEFRAGTATSISGLKMLDDYTVVVELSRIFSGFVASLAQFCMIPEHVLGEVPSAELRQHAFWSTLPIGTGPYKLSKYVPNQTIEYERNVDYHLGKPYIEKQIWTAIPESQTQVLALQKGDLDYVYSMPSEPETIQSVADDPNLYLLESVDPRVQQMGIHCGRFNDVRVRQAICFAVDRNALLAAAGGDVAVQTDNYFQNPWAAEGALKWGDYYQYDPEKASSLLEEAGWDFGKEIMIEQMGTEPSAQMVMIQEQLQAVGLKVKLQMLETTVNYRDYDLLITGHVPLDPYELAARFTCRSTEEGGNTVTEYCNPDFDKLIDEEGMAKDQAGRGVVYKKMQEMLVKDAVSVLLPRTPNRCGLSKKVHVTDWAWYASDECWKWWMES